MHGQVQGTVVVRLATRLERFHQELSRFVVHTVSVGLIKATNLPVKLGRKESASL